MMAACEDDEGFTVVRNPRRPMPKGATLADFVVKNGRPKELSQRQWKNSFKALDDEYESDDSSSFVQCPINFPDCLHVHAKATVRGTARPTRVAPKRKPVSQPKCGLGARSETSKLSPLGPSAVPRHDDGTRRPTPLGPMVPHDHSSRITGQVPKVDGDTCLSSRELPYLDGTVPKVDGNPCLSGQGIPYLDGTLAGDERVDSGSTPPITTKHQRREEAHRRAVLEGFDMCPTGFPQVFSESGTQALPSGDASGAFGAATSSRSKLSHSDGQPVLGTNMSDQRHGHIEDDPYDSGDDSSDDGTDEYINNRLRMNPVDGKIGDNSCPNHDWHSRFESRILFRRDDKTMGDL